METELALEAERGCVRVMNLHKAKGLEGEIVVLAEHTGKFDFKPMSHREQMRDGKRLHLCLSREYAFGRQAVVWDGHWQEKQAAEKQYLDAEQIRLLYVAATRAKSMLIVNACKLWEPICAAIGGVEKSVEALTEMAARAQTDADRDRVDALWALYTPARFPWEEMDVSREPLPQVVSQNETPTRIFPEQMESSLRERVKTLSESERYAVTPSRLDHGSRASLLKKDRVGEADGAPEQAAVETAAESDLALCAPERPSGPCGPDWGTVVHRVMELCVRDGRFDKADIAAFARQAVSETLGDAPLTGTQRRMLGGGTDTSDDALLASVAGAAAKAAGFAASADAPLRRLISGAECYPELPFQLYAADRESEVYRHLSRHISDENARDKALETQGVIDLAVRKDGVWTIVDYKTDIQRYGESAAQFRARLKAEYTPQITAYAKVMEQFSGERIDSLYLCSIQLGGELIELTADGAADLPEALSATVQQEPVRPTGKTGRYKASELLTRHGFSSGVRGCAGAEGFALWYGGAPVTLKGKDGAEHASLRSCREFAGGIVDWVRTQWPDAAASVDTTDVGSVQVMRRTLRMLRKALPITEWEELELSWERRQK